MVSVTQCLAAFPSELGKVLNHYFVIHLQMLGNCFHKYIYASPLPDTR